MDAQALLPIRCRGFVVLNRCEQPLMVFQIDDASHLAEAHLHAYIQMRRAFNLLLDHTVDGLWGVSLMGTKALSYHANKDGQISPTPPLDSLHTEYMKDDWKIDLLSKEGFGLMKDIHLDIVG